jgi:hypothetical protein
MTLVSRIWYLRGTALTMTLRYHFAAWELA